MRQSSLGQSIFCSRPFPLDFPSSPQNVDAFGESNLFQQLFEEIVDRCWEAGLVEGEHLSVDGSFLPANASRLSRIPREQLTEVAPQSVAADVWER